jgi:hypothetical protein
MYHSLLDTAGYPSAGSSLPIETLRRVDPAAKAPDQTQQGMGVPQASDSTYK